MAASPVTLPPTVIPPARQTMPPAPDLPPAVVIPDASPIPLPTPRMRTARAPGLGTYEVPVI
jgi:hypothetical protein